MLDISTHYQYNLTMTAPDKISTGIQQQPTDLTTLEQLSPPVSRKRLSIPAVSILLSKNFKPAQIARQMGVSVQAVCEYINNHNDELQALTDFDLNVTTRIRGVVNRVVDHLEQRDFKRDRLGDISNLMGIGIDKIRLIEGKSTANVSSIIHISASVEAHIQSQQIKGDVKQDDTIDKGNKDNIIKHDK